MDQVLLAKSAENLEKALAQYLSVDTEVSDLSDALSKLITDARTGKIMAPIEWGDVPGVYSFTEGGLRKYDDLETAYAKFKIEVTGGGEVAGLKSLCLNAIIKS